MRLLCGVITINSIAPVDISVDQIWLFGFCNRIKGLWKASMKKCFDIVANQRYNPKKKPVDQKTTPKTAVNQKRYFNVMSLAMMKSGLNLH